MSVQPLLTRLEGVRRTGERRWRARCPAHGSRGGTLAIREAPDGRLLLHCHAGCTPESVLHATGLDWGALHPKQRLTDERIKPIVKPWRASDVVRAFQTEIDVALIILSDVAQGKEISERDRARAGECTLRIARLGAELDDAH